MSFTWLPINTFNAGVNPSYQYNDPKQFYDPISNIIANVHTVLAVVSNAVNASNGVATAIQAGTALDPGTVGGVAISSAFIKTGTSTTANVIATGTALDPGTLGGITLANAVLTLSSTAQTVTGNTAFTNGMTVTGTETVDFLRITGGIAPQIKGPPTTDFHISGGTAGYTFLDSPNGSVILTVGGQSALQVYNQAGANSVNYFQMAGAGATQSCILYCYGETTGGLDFRSGNGPMYVNGFAPQDVIIGARNPASNATTGFPCVPVMTSNPTGTPVDGNVGAGWVGPLVAVSNTVNGSYSLQTYLNNAWRTIPIGNTITSSAIPATTGLLGGSGSQGQANAVAIGTNLSLSAGTLSAGSFNGGTITGALTVNTYAVINGQLKVNTVSTPANVFTPTTGATVTVPSMQQTALIQPATSIATLTVVLPSSTPATTSYCVPLDIFFGNAVTSTITWSSVVQTGGAALPTTVTTGQKVSLMYFNTVNTWFHYTTI